MTTRLNRLALVGGIPILVMLIALIEFAHPRRGIAIDEGGRTVQVENLNAGITNASGEFNVLISIKYPDGSPASGLEYRLELPMSSSNVIAGAGILSTNGTAVIGGLAGGSPPVLYNLYAENTPVGLVAINSTSGTNRFEGLLPARVGMRAPELALADLEGKTKFQLSDLHGQFVLLEFYTTHCAPCRPVLAKLNALLERRAGDWKGKVRILAVGLDAVYQPDISAGTVAKHLRRAGWKSLRPIVPDQEFSWEPAKQFPFGVTAVPYAFLIGRDGIVLSSGIPDIQEVEHKIEELLKNDVH